MARKRGSRSAGKHAGNRDLSPGGKKTAREEENAMKNVLRMLGRSPHLPAQYLEIARGVLLLATYSPNMKNAAAGAPAAHEAKETTTEDEDKERFEAACAFREELRKWFHHGGSRLKAREALASLRANCKEVSPELRRVVLAHLSCVQNPSQVCKDLGTVAGILISELERFGDGVEEAQSNTADKNNGLDASTNEDGEAMDGDAKNVAGNTEESARSPTPTPTRSMRKASESLQAKARKARSKSMDACTRGRRFHSGGLGSLFREAQSMYSDVWRGEGKSSLQQQEQHGGDEVRPQPMPTDIQERCKEVLQKVDHVTKLVDDLNQVAYSSEALQDKDDATQEKKAPMQAVQDDLFEAVQQLLAWKPTPTRKRDSFRYNAQLTRAAGILLQKILIPEGPIGFWPLLRPSLSGTRAPTKAGAFGVKVAFFRRKKGLGEAAGGGARSSGRTKHGVWSFAACSFRYASKPPVPTPALAV